MSPVDNDVGNWDVFLPLKQFVTGKSRLQGLPNNERKSLIRAMANDVIDAILQLSNVGSITIVGLHHLDVTTNPDLRIRSFPLTQMTGINNDVRRAIGASNKISVILPDLPSITSAELAIALDLASANEQSFIPDFSGKGTTIYFVTNSNAFNPQFGPNSALEHLKNGAKELSHPAFAGIMRDCDDFTDLGQIPLSALGRATRSIMEHRMRK